MYIDTHTHLYLDAFKEDRQQIVETAIAKGVSHMLLPNIDKDSIGDMHALHSDFPDSCLPMMGLHPTSVSDNYEEELARVAELLDEFNYIAVGEIGIDLYWDQAYREHQLDAFRRQLRLAKKHRLPVSIHTREAFDLVYGLVKEELNDDLKGIFHCFTGSAEEAKKIADLGFLMGIGGVVTFKKAGLAEVVKDIPSRFLVLETDAPFLTPAPFRGKRNESSYLTYIAQKIADMKACPLGKLDDIWALNAADVFNIKI